MVGRLGIERNLEMEAKDRETFAECYLCGFPALSFSLKWFFLSVFSSSDGLLRIVAHRRPGNVSLFSQELLLRVLLTLLFFDSLGSCRAVYCLDLPYTLSSP